MHQIERSELERFFELSLAIGTSLHAQENARVFLGKLVELTNLSFAGLWLRAPYDGAYRLEFSFPDNRQALPEEVDLSHPVLKKLEAQPYFTEVLTEAGDTPEFIHSRHLGAGTYGYFQLPVFSFVQIFEPHRDYPFDKTSMGELSKLIVKFGISMDACMVHARLRDQQQLVNQVQGQLEKSVAQYSDLFENMSDALLILNDQHQIVKSNRAGQRLLDVTPTSSGEIPKHLELSQFIHPEDRDKFEYFLRKLLDYESDRSFKCRLLTNDRVERFVAFNSTLVRNISGHQSGSRHIVRDISSQMVYETRLNKLNTHLKALVSNLQASILFEDADRKTLLVNEMFCQRFNIPYYPGDITGLEAEILLQEVAQQHANPEHFKAWSEKALAGRKLSIGEKFTMPDGRVLSFDAIPVYTDNEYLGLLWQSHDITERETAQAQLQESEERYRGILENMELGLLEMDESGVIVRAFDRFCEMLGYEEEELVGKKPEDVFIASAEIAPHTQKYQKEPMAPNAGIYEQQFIRKDGTRIWAIVSSTPIQDRNGQLKGSISIHYDITERKDLEQSLEAAKIRAEKAMRAERQFLANMSHEIRTPMNAVIGMTHLLLDTKPNPEQRDYLESLKFSADSLLSLIDNILDLSKIEAHQLTLEATTFSLRNILNNLKQSFQLKVKNDPLSIDLDLDENIDHLLIGDPTRLSQIFTNLLGNAIKFTSRGTIGIKARILERSQTNMDLQFIVFDTGIGIAAEKLDLVFKNFKQADSNITRKYGGTGLGLSIVKQLVELMGGTIWVESELGKGTTFLFNLSFPISEQPDDQEVKFSFSNSQHKGVFRSLWVLLVEDNPMNQKLAGHILEQWGCHYEIANDGEEAVQKTRERFFDIILMDIHMPNMDGCEATAQIRADGDNPNCSSQIIGLTAAAMLDEKKRAIEAGMNEFLTKPFSPDMLAELMLKSLQVNTLPKKKKSIMKPDEEQKPNPISIDFAYLNEFSGGDEGFIKEIVETFLHEAPTNLEHLADGLSQEDWDTVYRMAHQLKPNYMMLGMTAQQEAALSIEQMAKTGPGREKIEPMIKQLVADTKHAFPLLKEKVTALET